MPNINQDIEIWAGDDVEIAITLYDIDGTTPLNLSSATINWALSSVYDTDTAILTKTSSTPGEVTITDGPGGLVSVYLINSETASLGGQPYRHEVEIVDGTATSTVLVGMVTVNKTTLHPPMALR